MIDFAALDRRLEGKAEVGVLSTEDYRDMIKPVYDHIRARHPGVNVFLLNGEGMLCPLKTEILDFFVLLGVWCPLHRFKDFVGIETRVAPEDLCRLQGESRAVVYDPSHVDAGHGEDAWGKDVVVVTRNQMFYDYYFYRHGAESFYGLEAKDRMQYLGSKCNKGEKIRGLQIFAIVFTSREYEPLAKAIRAALVSRHKNAYLLLLKDLSYERMITIEGTECIVVVDCPFFECSLDLHIPIVTPFEVEYALCGQWGRFDKNSFCVPDAPASTCTALERIGRAGSVLLRLAEQSVPFCREDEDDVEVHCGQSGTACRYDAEGA